MGSEVFFTRSLAPEKVVEAYQKLGIRLSGKVAVKIHSGEVWGCYRWCPRQH